MRSTEAHVHRAVVARNKYFDCYGEEIFTTKHINSYINSSFVRKEGCKYPSPRKAIYYYDKEFREYLNYLNGISLLFMMHELLLRKHEVQSLAIMCANGHRSRIHIYRRKSSKKKKKHEKCEMRDVIVLPLSFYTYYLYSASQTGKRM